MELKQVGYGIVEHDAYVVKYALTKGIQHYKKCHVNLRNWELTTPFGKKFVDGEYTLLDLENAKQIANTMRIKKILQLRKQIDKLESLDFYEH